MKKVFLVRHAESEGNVGGYFEHSHVIKITEKGRQQSEDLVEILMQKPLPHRIIVSKFIRTVETAEPFIKKLVENNHPHDVHLWLETHEFEPHDGKKSEGMTLDERGKFYEIYWDKLDPFKRESDNSETFKEFIDRIIRLMHKLIKIPDGVNYVFTHGVVIRAFLLMEEHMNLYKKIENGEDKYKELMMKFRDFIKVFKTQNTGVYDISKLVEKYNV